MNCIEIHRKVDKQVEKNCDWVYGNHSKLHIGSYKIKILKHYNNQTRIVST